MTKQTVIARSIIVVLYVALTAVMFGTGSGRTIRTPVERIDSDN